jgi:hypothetical protein
MKLIFLLKIDSYILNIFFLRDKIIIKKKKKYLINFFFLIFFLNENKIYKFLYINLIYRSRMLN